MRLSVAVAKGSFSGARMKLKVPNFLFLAVGASLMFATSTADAAISVSQVIVEFNKPGQRRADVEVQNRGRERMYVVVLPSRIMKPGLPGERRVNNPDPSKLGLLVSPQRMILDPGQRRLVRFAVLSAPGSGDRIYRVQIKPVVGKIVAKKTGVKILVGYDVLVMQRPNRPDTKLVGKRQGGWLVFKNNGNTNALLFNGKQCAALVSKRCRRLPPRRLYSGAQWRLKLKGSGPVNYLVRSGTQTTRRSF